MLYHVGPRSQYIIAYDRKWFHLFLRSNDCESQFPASKSSAFDQTQLLYLWSRSWLYTWKHDGIGRYSPKQLAQLWYLRFGWYANTIKHHQINWAALVWEAFSRPHTGSSQTLQGTFSLWAACFQQSFLRLATPWLKSTSSAERVGEASSHPCALRCDPHSARLWQRVNGLTSHNLWWIRRTRLI